ncbi:MAG: hypothetical protein DYG98_23265 [Haliscomenobacteraceae bacterium CHB4]|nr:hypothetical protein [Haliscomenobacteraceae bacterium CHB4]
MEIHLMKISQFSASMFLFAGLPFLAQAQLSVGGGISYGSEVEAVGIQPRVIYTISGPWRAAADFNFYLDGKEKVTYWDLNLNGHYAFHEGDAVTAYALAGLNFFHAEVDTGSSLPGFEDVSDTETGLNIGAGVQLPLGRLSGLLEARYVLGDYDQLVLSACVLFPINGN